MHREESSTNPGLDCPSVDILEAIALGGDIPPKFGAHLARCKACAEFIETARFSARFGRVMAEQSGSDSDQSPRLPDAFGYEIIGEMSRGGQGVVYRATQIATGQTVAIKLLHTQAGGMMRQARRRFAREVRIASSLNHPGIVRIYDSLILNDGRDALVMELVEGVSLSDWIRKRSSLDQRSRLELLALIADAVHHAHLHSVIHRDLKPSNILVDLDGKPHLLDFGIARRSCVLDATDQITLAGEFMGTLTYAAPEQVSQEESVPDIRTDIYALGIIGFEVITGSLPYPVDGSLESVVHSILTSDPADRTRSGLATDVWLVFAKALSKDPSRRYQSMDAFARDLRNAASGRAIEARADSRFYRIRKSARRHRVVLSLVAVAVLGLAGALAVQMRSNAQLSRTLRESRLQQFHAFLAAENREQSERVLWAEFDRFVPGNIDAIATLWNGPLVQRELLWCFIEMQAKATCLQALRNSSAHDMGLTALQDGSFALMTPDRRIGRVTVVDDEVLIEPGPKIPVNAKIISVTPSGEYFITSDLRILRVYDFATGILLNSLELPVPDQSQQIIVVANWGVALTDPGGRLLVYSIPNLALIGELDAVASPQIPWLDLDRPEISYISSDNRLITKDLVTGQSFEPLKDPVTPGEVPDRYPQVLLSPDRSEVIVALGGGMLVRELGGAKPPVLLMSHPGYRVQASNDRDWRMVAAVAYGDPTLHIWSTSDWKELPGLTGHKGTVISHAFTTESDRILTTDAAGTLRLWATPGYSWRSRFGMRTSLAHQIAIANSSSLLYVPDETGRVQAYSNAQDSRRTTVGRKFIVPYKAVRVDADDTAGLLAVAGMGDRIDIFDTTHDTDASAAVIELNSLGPIVGMRFSPIGGSMLAACTDRGNLVFIDPTLQKIMNVVSIPTGSMASDLGWAPNGEVVAVSFRDGTVVLVDLENSGQIVTHKVSDSQLRCVEFSPNGKTIAVVGDEGRLICIDAATGRVRISERFSEHSLFAIAYHPSSNTLLVGDRAGRVTVLDAKSMKEIAAFDAGGSVMSMRFSADGRSLFVSALDRAVERWDFSWLAETLPQTRPMQ